jgi:3',5'-cyclic AMP phosphodiesterase CpdA
MKTKMFLLLAFVCQCFLSCKKDFTKYPVLDDAETNPGKNEGNSHLKIAIVSDIHYMHPSLLINDGAEGKAFQDYLNQDPKLVQYSDPIWRQVMAALKAEKPDVLLVPGDITKDGEKIGHEAMARFFYHLEQAGTKVYVVPGNHDINNAKAKLYDGNEDRPVDMTTSTDFATIYGSFGYNEAIARDPRSLSYVVQVNRGLRLIGIDASKYEDYGPSGDVAAGRIKPETLTWILAQMAEAKAKNMTFFAMMHHNLIEHYAGQATLDPGYVIDDWENVAKQLMDAGLKVIFTGHYHANDISSYSVNGNELYDVQTGSLVTAPSPYRILTMKDNKLDISSNSVQSINATLPGNLPFPAYANLFLSQHLDGYFNYYLPNVLGVPAPLTTIAAPLFRNGIMAHFAGDEKMPPDERQKIEELGAMSQQLAGIVTTLWTDTGIKDNKTQIPY